MNHEKAPTALAAGAEFFQKWDYAKSQQHPAAPGDCQQGPSTAESDRPAGLADTLAQRKPMYWLPRA